MSELKESILKEIEEKVSSGIDREEAVDSILKKEYKSFYRDLSILKRRLGLDTSTEDQEINNLT